MVRADKKTVRAIAIIVVSIIHFTVSRAAFSQITINLPKLPKIGKQKQTEQGKTENQDTKPSGSAQKQTKNSDGKHIYGIQRPTDTPVFLKNSIYIQAITQNRYWKAPNESNYSSWVPSTRFWTFAKEKPLNYAVEYFNPDGSAWYSEKLEQSSTKDAEAFQSPSPWGGVLDTKSTVGTGLYSFKITNQDTKEVIYQGKFKVGKFSTGNGPREKNKVDFFVDHDWLMPFGMVGFHQGIDEMGMQPVVVSVWLKGQIDASELEGRIFFKGQQIASTKDVDHKSYGTHGAADYDKRSSEFSASHSPLNSWKRWEFSWQKFLFDNNGLFNRDNYPGAHYADKNPGDYVVKIYRNDAQIRELTFSIGPDGKFAVPAYTNQIFMLYHTVVLPVKVLGTTEKWNATAWKTDAFYGNPISGFAIQ